MNDPIPFPKCKPITKAKKLNTRQRKKYVVVVEQRVLGKENKFPEHCERIKILYNLWRDLSCQRTAVSNYSRTDEQTNNETKVVKQIWHSQTKCAAVTECVSAYILFSFFDAHPLSLLAFFLELERDLDFSLDDFLLVGGACKTKQTLLTKKDASGCDLLRIITILFLYHSIFKITISSIGVFPFFWWCYIRAHITILSAGCLLLNILFFFCFLYSPSI